MLLPEHAYAQKRHRQEAVALPDTTAWFRGVAVSVDAVGAIQRWVSDYGQYEAALRINLKDRYFPIVELGIGDADREEVLTGIHYKTNAPYGRIGIDFNLMKDKHDIYRLYAGARYAYTSFKYDLTGRDVQDPVWKTQADYGASAVSCRYHWAEAVAGVDAKIVGPLRLGWSVRYRSRLSHKHGETGRPWYVPGFGKDDSSNLGATFNITLEL